MAQIKNFGLTGVASDVQFGKGGARLVQADGLFSLRNAAGAFTRLQIADPSLGNDAVHKSYVDAGISAIQSELDLTQTSTGLNPNGSLPTLVGSYISASSSIRAAVEALDAALQTEATTRSNADIALGTRIDAATTAIGQVFSSFTAFETTVNGSLTTIGTTLANHESRIASLETGNNSVKAELDFTQEQIGLATNGAFSPLNGTFGLTATTVVGAISQLQTALGGVDDNLSAVEAAAGLTSAGSLTAYDPGATILSGATTLKGGIEAVATFAQGVDGNLSAVETSVGLNSDGSMPAFSGTMLSGASSVIGAINALRDAADGRLDSLETETARLNTTLTENYINRNGSVSMAASLNMGGFAIHSLPVQNPADNAIPNTDAASVGFVRGKIAELAGAFQYEGTLTLGTIAAEAMVLPNTWDAGSYFKAANSGYYSFVGSGTALFANANDGLVKNNGNGWDKIDNTDSTVQGTPNFVDVSGSADFGFVVDLAGTFKQRLVDAEASIGTLSTGLAATQGSLVAVDTRLTAAESSITSVFTFASGSLSALTTSVNGSLAALTSYVDAEIAEVQAELDATQAGAGLEASGSLAWGTSASSLINATTSLRAAIEALSGAGGAVQAELDTTQAAVGLNTDGTAPSITATYAAGATTVLGALNNVASGLSGSLVALTTYVDGEIAAVEAQITAVDGNLSVVETSVGLDAAGSIPAGAFTGSYVSGSFASVIAAINSLGTAAAAVDGSLSAAITAEATARANADTAITTELDATQTLIGFANASGTSVGSLAWSTAAPAYVTSAVTVMEAIEDTAIALANLSQDEIRSASGQTRVKAATSGVEMSVPVGSGTFLAMTVEATASADSNVAMVATAGEIQMVAEGTPSNINIRLIPKGTGQVFIGSEGATSGVIGAEPGEDLIITGGNSPADPGGDLILKGGDGSTDGIVEIQSGSGAAIARFSNEGPNRLDFTGGSTTLGLVAAGSGNIDIVLDPLGTGRVDVSNAVVANMATPSVSTDGANKGYVDTQVATSIANAFAGAVRTRVITLTGAGSVNLGDTIVGTVLRVKASVTGAFGAGQTLLVGVSGNTAALAAAGESDLETTGMYVIENATAYGSATQLLAEVTGTGTGSVTVVVEFLQG